MIASQLHALCLEIVDCLMVLVARGWTRIVIHSNLTASETRVRELDVQSPNPPLPRPSLGVDEQVCMGNLSAALHDMRSALRNPAFGATLQLDRDANHIKFSSTHEHVTLFEHTLTPKDLAMLFYSEPLFDALIMSRDAIVSAQRQLEQRILGFDDWNFDAPTSTLSWMKGVLPWQSARAQVLGTWVKESESWLWSWANRSLEPQSMQAASTLRDQSAEGFRVFQQPTFPTDEGFVSTLSALAAHRVKATGTFRGDFGPGWIYFAVWL